MKKRLTFDIEADELEVFLQDVNERLQAMETGILHLERAADPDALNATFRAVHTLKAVAATVGHQQMAELAHTVETLFDAMREGRLSPTQVVTDELLVTVDVLKALRDEVVNRRPSGADVAAALARLRALTPDGQAAGEEGVQAAATGQPGPRQLTPEQAARVHDCREEGHTILEIEVTASADSFAPAARLLQAAMALMEAGQVIAQHPSQADLANEQHDGRLWLILATQADEEAVEELLRDISDLAGVRVQPYAAAYPAARDGPGSSQRLPEAPKSQKRDKTVRISVERLDTLMNLVGELVTDRTRLVQIEGTLRGQYGKAGIVGELDEMAVHLGRVVDQLQQEVMQARMVPIAHLFAKLPRLVRDVARAADKQVELIIEGEATELDRSIIEAIGDPLIHLLRNAVDHGIESPQARAEAGKPPSGTLRLTAEHAEGHIVVMVQDDGRGIDPAQIRRAAVSRGLLSEEEAAQLSEDETIALIFRPNLSTAEQVTGVSGRGVGLDVVQTNVKRLGGSVVVDSELGRGTTFRITLPLTLAIVQTMLVGLGGGVYAIPLTSVVESLYLADVNISGVKGNPTIYWRDQALPLLYLRQFFAHPRLAATSAKESEQAVVTVAWGKLRVGLIVDRLIGKQEIVVKALSPVIGSLPGLSGCTILGDGRIALIMDVPGLISAAMQAQRQGVAT
jgi:two-component system chemotaxis sensor kinase CheA